MEEEVKLKRSLCPHASAQGFGWSWIDRKIHISDLFPAALMESKWKKPANNSFFFLVFMLKDGCCSVLKRPVCKGRSQPCSEEKSLTRICSFPGKTLVISIPLTCNICLGLLPFRSPQPWGLVKNTWAGLASLKASRTCYHNLSNYPKMMAAKPDDLNKW